MTVAATLTTCATLCSTTTRQARGWRRHAIAAAAGSLSVLAMAPFFFWPILFLTIPVWIWLIEKANDQQDGSTVRSAAVAGWWFGFGYFFFGLFWIGEAFLVQADVFGWLLPFAVTIMPAGLALFYAAASAASVAVWPRLSSVPRLLIFAVAVATAEWLRGHILTGFPWNVLGYALTYPLPLMQSASIIGIYGLTIWTVIIFASPLVFFADQSSTSNATLKIATLSALPLAIMFGYGALRLSTPPPPPVEGVSLRIVQPSVPQGDKWRPDKQREIFADHLDLSRRKPHGEPDDLAGITHLLWPEASMPFMPLDAPEALTAIGQLLPKSTYLLAGALRIKHTTDKSAKGASSDSTAPAVSQRQVFNSLLVFGFGGGLTALYDKIHLVPFGEYLPFQKTLESIGLEQLSRMRGGFTSGSNPRQLLHVPGLPPVGALICYEAIFPAQVIQGEERPGVLVNVTNDGWFGDMTGPYQHFHQNRVRAVEEGLPLLRVSNNGISAVIDPHGRVLQQLGLNVRGSLDTRLPSAINPPIYARFADALFWLNILILIALSAGFGLWRKP